MHVLKVNISHQPLVMYFDKETVLKCIQYFENNIKPYTRF